MKHAVAVLLTTTAVMACQSQTAPVTLDSLRDHKRVLLVFANGNNQQAEAQLTVAADHAAGFRERDLVLVGVYGSDPAVPNVRLTPEEDLLARKRLHIRPGEFTVLLLGKDGGEKMRSHTAMAWDMLQGTIDAMPMRRQEMRAQ